jgi:hypothetical protein
MNLTVNEADDLLKIIERNQAISIGREFGLEFLTDEDIERLEQAGINVEELYSPDGDTIFTSFNLGLLSEALGQTETNKLYSPYCKRKVDSGKYKKAGV